MASSYFMLKILKRKRTAQAHNRREIEETRSSQEFSKTVSTTDQKCRICFKEGKIPIYDHGSATDISENIRIFGDIEINEEDNYPKYLCDSCHSLLQNAILFRKLAKESHTLLYQKPINLPSEDLPCPSDNEYEDYVEETPKSYNCKLCKLNFRTTEEYVTHKNSKQHKNVRIQCPICLGLLTAQLYKRHLARHKSASHLVCEVCGKMYRKDNLVRHLQLHSFELPFQCQVCPYRGRFMESLKIHMRSHTGDKPFSCDKCQLRFLTRSNLNRHLLTHKKERPFKCVECGRGFYTKRDLDIHYNSDHAGVKDFGCKLCGNKYGTRKALMRHELRVHKRDKMAKGRMPLYLQEEYRKLCEN